RRQRTDTWESAASVSDPAAECAPYSYAPVQAMVKSYPTIWEIASVSQPGIDPLASTLFNQLSPSIPNIKVKGTPTGDFSASNTTYSRSDPDCWWTFSNCTTPKLAGLVHDVASCPEPNTWGLSIDDGPNCSHNAYYDFLRQSNQKATLFYVGSNVIDWPLEAQRGLADGHEICAHTWSHRYMTGLTNEQVFAELYFSKKIIKDVLGVTVQCWRPPFGDVDDRVRFIANALGMSTILWDNDVNDFRYATLGQAVVNAKYQGIIDAASKGAYSTHGTIVLSHELNADTMTTNQNFLPKISQAFKYITPVAVCQNNSQPYVETNFTYP
ncbi:family 4 carbohydrate esterase, partial [Melampsora larici-populina 98AG31]